MSHSALEQEARFAEVKAPYLAPRIITYTSDEILEQLGPALTGSEIIS